MKKIILLALFTIFVFYGCEKDDFCIKNPVTPNLVLRFYDDADRTSLKTAQQLSVWAENKDTIVTYTSTSTDSIAIPLNSAANSTTYYFKTNATDTSISNNEVSSFVINYTPKEEYVSRSCGFKVIFENVSFSAQNGWIKDFSPATLTTINNQNAAHVQIFH